MAIYSTADGSNVTFALMAESTLATLPGTPHFTRKRHTGAAFESAFVYGDNNEVLEGKQVGGKSLIALDVSGQVPFQMLLGEYDNDLEKAALLAGALVTNTIVGVTTIAYSSVGNTITLSGAAVNGFNTIVPGAWILITNSAGNSGLKQVESKTSGSIITTVETLVTEAAGSSTIKYAFYTNGTTRTSFLAETWIADVATGDLVQGIVPSGWEFTVDKKSIVTGSFPCVSISQGPIDASIENSTYIAATTGEPVNGTTQLKSVTLRPYNSNGTHSAPLVCSLNKLAFKITNGARMVDGIGEGLFPVNIGTGPLMVEINCSAYFRDKHLFNAALNGTVLSFSFYLTDAAGKYKAFTIQKCKMTTNKRSPPSNASDITTDFTLTGQVDNYTNGTGKTLIVSNL